MVHLVIGTYRQIHINKIMNSGHIIISQIIIMIAKITRVMTMITQQTHLVQLKKVRKVIEM